MRIPDSPDVTFIVARALYMWGTRDSVLSCRELKVRVNKLLWFVPAFIFLAIGCRRKPPVNPEALHRAAEKGDTKRIQILISNGADINAKDLNKWTPLYWATSGDHREAAELLIASGADVNVRDGDRTTPLHMAARYGHGNLIELLVAKRAEINARGYRDRTPLHRAASAGHTIAVELLIASGADVEARDKEGETPLHYAASADQTETVGLLIDKGACSSLKALTSTQGTRTA
jgi:ankyrin repeat protein